MTPVDSSSSKKRNAQEDLKNNGTSLARTVTIMFSSKTVNDPTLIDDSFMFEDLPLFIKETARKVIVSKFKFFNLKL